MVKSQSHLSTITGALLALTFVCAGICGQLHTSLRKAYEPTFVLVEQYPSKVISKASPGAEGIGFGFEGGRVIKIDHTYHLFTTEMMPGHLGVKTRMAHWRSPDRIHWERVATLYESSGDFTG